MEVYATSDWKKRERVWFYVLIGKRGISVISIERVGLSSWAAEAALAGQGPN